MKFIVIASVRKQLALPPDALPSVLSAQREWIHERVSEGTIDTIFGFVNGGGVAIVNADDGDELNMLLMSSPAYLVNEWEVRPLVDIDVALSSAIDMFERATGRIPIPR
jgi:muconolactone delta-isomerase